MNQVATFNRKTADEQLSKAKISVMMDKRLVFFSVLMMNMAYRWKTDIKTAGTNGRSILINPDFFTGLTPAERIFLVVHEVCHVAFAHLMRKGNRDHQKWNRACDYFINLMLVDQGFTCPKIGLLDRQYANLSAEEIYDRLPDAIENGWEMDMLPPEDSPEDEDEPAPITDAQQQAAMDQLVLQATMQAQRSAGANQIPSAILFYLDQLLHPKLRWDIMLKRWFGQYIKKGYNWKTPNRRYSHEYLPSRGKPSLSDAAFATDISGSVSDADYQVIVSEVGGVMDKMKPKFIHYIQFSEMITSITKVSTVRQLKAIEFKGRGGTCVRDLFRWADEHKPRVLVILTDGDFYWPREGDDPWDQNSPIIHPKCDVVWIIHNNPEWTAPVGKVIHYNINR